MTFSFPQKVLAPIKHYLQDKEKLLLKRKAALTQADPFTDAERLNDNAAVDTEAAEQFGHANVMAMRKEVDRTLIAIRKTLTRIKIGKYGMCESCGEMIDTDRLAIDPTAQYCITCAQKQT